MRISNWYAITICSDCEKGLTYNQKMYSKGICPKCGRNGNSTICGTIEVVLQQISHHPWWRFWNKDFEYIGKDKFSNDWIDKTK